MYNIALLDDDKRIENLTIFGGGIIIVIGVILIIVSLYLKSNFENNFVEYPNVVSPGHNYKNVSTNSNMFDLCWKNSSCAGFMSDGRLKDKIVDRSKWIPKTVNTLYVKSSIDDSLPRLYSRIGIAVRQVPPYDSIVVKKAKWGLFYKISNNEFHRQTPLVSGEIIQPANKGDKFRIHLDGTVNPPIWYQIGNIINNKKTSLQYNLEQKGTHFRAIAPNGKVYYIPNQYQNQIKNGGIVKLFSKDGNENDFWNVYLTF